jgi:uncharacterized membrane protein
MRESPPGTVRALPAQALSPALNQPTTAVHVLDRLEDLLLRAAARPEPTGLWLDAAGTVRLVERTTGWAELLQLSVEEIVVYGIDSPQVAHRLDALLDRLAAVVPAAHRPAVHRRRAALATAGGPPSGEATWT